MWASPAVASPSLESKPKAVGFEDKALSYAPQASMNHQVWELRLPISGCNVFNYEVRELDGRRGRALDSCQQGVSAEAKAQPGPHLPIDRVFS